MTQVAFETYFQIYILFCFYASHNDPTTSESLTQSELCPGVDQPKTMFSWTLSVNKPILMGQHQCWMPLCGVVSHTCMYGDPQVILYTLPSQKVWGNTCCGNQVVLCTSYRRCMIIRLIYLGNKPGCCTYVVHMLTFSRRIDQYVVQLVFSRMCKSQYSCILTLTPNSHTFCSKAVNNIILPILDLSR